MGSKLYVGNGQATPSIVVEKPVPMPLTIQLAKDQTGKLVKDPSANVIDFTGITDAGNYVLYGTYQNNTTITGHLDLSSLTKVTGQYAFENAFYGCTEITSVDLSSLEIAEAWHCCYNMFYNCTGITSVDLSNLKATGSSDSCCQYMFGMCSGLTGHLDLSSINTANCARSYMGMFADCTNLTSVDLSGLVSAHGYYSMGWMFGGCRNLQSIDISRLAKIANNDSLSYMLNNCTSLTNLEFNGLAYTTTNFNGSLNNILSGVTGCTVHFPQEWENTMSTWSNVTNGFGGTNTTVLFDLPNVTELDLSSVTIIFAPQQFQSFASNNYFSNVTSVNLSNLKEIKSTQSSSSMFSGCTSLTSVDLSSLSIINGYYCGSMFYGCTSLTSVDLSSLSIISGNQNGSMFSNCTSLTELKFPALKRVDSSSNFNSFLSGVNGCTVHFPKNLSGLNPGGNNTIKLYDLPATNTLTGINTSIYTRNPKYDTQTSLAWKVGEYGTTNLTPTYYTSSLNDPQVGDTIYSDPECAQAVTTIDSIV